jgi:hypothetical protein
MENKQAQLDIQQSDRQHIEFHVSYLDTESGRIEHEEFSDRPAAERFANAQLRDEDAWAVVDVIPLQQQPLQQQPVQQHQDRAQQLVA